MKINEVILKPMLTEKATKHAQGNIYTFEVDKKATKHQIAAAIHELYNVKVIDMRVMVRKGKVRRVGRRMSAKTMPDRKIAYVRIKEGTINVFPKI